MLLGIFLNTESKLYFDNPDASYLSETFSLLTDYAADISTSKNKKEISMCYVTLCSVS